MCGIFGILVRPGAALDHATAGEMLGRLYALSESRGKESAGLHVYRPDSGEAWTLKGAKRATELLRGAEYQALMAGPVKSALRNGTASAPLALLAHSRLVTNGAAELPQNNQPVRSGHVTMIHNGICVNVDALWREHPHLRRLADVDTEVMAALTDSLLAEGRSPSTATQEMFTALRGAASVAWVHAGSSFVTLATNTGDLYFIDRLEQGFLVFASERYILESATSQALPGTDAMWLAPKRGVSIDLASDMPLQEFDLAGSASAHDEGPFCLLSRPTVQHDLGDAQPRAAAVINGAVNESLVRYNEARMASFRRCSRCVLPETFPFIAFDGQGVCNYCASYRPKYRDMHPIESRRDFIRSLERYRRPGPDPDVLVAFSGGRDSSYGLHLIKKEFGLKPVTFTYDWGMVTDLARRNVARICGQLGIQNILVSADIASKRDNIRKNVAAWLKRPDLGLVPLFMAGDKHFFRVVNQLKRQTGIDLDLWCANPLENTDFKSGFCGVRPDFAKKRVDYLSMGRKARLAAYYGLRFLQNPAYLNSSLTDTFGAFTAYYMERRRDFFFIFDHFVWNEAEVNRTLLSEYDWELSPDSPSTWRIGDGTAPFYNYIYLTARGFSEFDTFRSNQIREGHITREEALANVLVENRPRVPSLRWYLETIGLEFDSVIRRINALDSLGLHR
jgi:glutamine---fructose-6-phosphate transaminase (isomerizing)